MKKKTLFQKFSGKIAVLILTGALLLSGCGTNNAGSGEQTGKDNSATSLTEMQASSYASQSGSGEVTVMDVSDMFSNRDLNAEYDESECILITLSGSEATCDSSAVSVTDHVIVIKEAGSYILRGSYDGSVRVEAPEDAKVQLILDNVELQSDSTAAIYVKTADKVFLTMAEGSTNKITNNGEFVAIDDNNVDGAIYSKSDLTLNGNGKLIVSSEKGHGIVSKDDLKITGGTYEITAGDHGISGKDSIRIADGSITITAAEDGLHSGNDEDADKGYVYIAGGEITIHAGDDGIHGETKVVIADGTINVAKSNEGIEGAIVEIAGGNVTVTASDDGINATDGSGSQAEMMGGRGGQNNLQQGNENTDVYILISGGRVIVDAKGDGIDSNGSLYVNGGEVYVSGPENNGNGSLDYDGTGKITGGSFIALGSTGMAMNFNNATQGSALITTSSTHDAGEQVRLEDQDGNVLISFTSTRKFASVLVSSPLMKQGETYVLTIGSETKNITLDQLIYGQSSGFGGMGGFGAGGMGRQGGMNGQDGNPEGLPQMPEGFDGNPEGRPQMPEGYDGNPEGRPQVPEGYDGNPEGLLQRPGRTEGSFEGRPQRPGQQNGST